MPRIGADRPALAVDTETTGVDFHHGACPFFVTTCDADGKQTWWEWDVDPLTRRVTIPDDDLLAIEQALARRTLVLQNAKFDVAALRVAGIDEEWPWSMTHDTLIAGHLLASNLPHDLTSMAMQYLGVDIAPLEQALKEAVQSARDLVRLRWPEWRIAKKDLPEMPSAKESVWAYDYWLPRAVAKELNYADDHPWYDVLAQYSNADSAVTLPLWQAIMAEIERRDLTAIYRERLKVLPIAYGMEQRGITLSRPKLEQLRGEYAEESGACNRRCVSIAASYGYELKLPKGAVNNSLREFCFDVMKLPPVYNGKSKSGTPSLDAKNAIPYYLDTLPERSKQRLFVQSLADKRRRDTALSYMASYERYWLATGEEGWYRLYPSLNPTGTDTLRWSSSRPNEQNISKKEGFNLRYCFGPAPGREWWSMDATNIELRIPAYEAGETAFIELFERPNDPPYYGSNHLLIAHLLWPRQFNECRGDDGELDGRIFKKRYKATHYQDTKNGNFAIQYGAMDRADGMGTADRTYKQAGAQAKIKQRFRKQEELNRYYIAQAEHYGYVETMPDKTVDPSKGYPLLCTRSEYGRILPTVPLAYHVSGTAMWWMMKAMIRCQQQIDAWNAEPYSRGYSIALQVHDELVFDFPAGTGDEPWRTNLSKARRLQSLMEQGGDDIGVPTPVSVEYHADNWSEGLTI